MFIKSSLKQQKVFLDDIKYIVALGDYIEAITVEAFAKILPKKQF